MTKPAKRDAVILEDGKLRPLSKCRTETLLKARTRTQAAGSTVVAPALEQELTKRKVKWKS